MRTPVALSSMQILGRVIGRRGHVVIAACLGASFLLAGIEYLIAILVALLLFSMHVSVPPEMPRWLAAALDSCSPLLICLALMAVGAGRAACLLVSKQAGLVLFEYVRARLCLVHGYEAVTADRTDAPSASRMNVRVWEYLPRTAEFVAHLTYFAGALLLATTVFACMTLMAWKEALLAAICLTLAGGAVLRLTKLLGPGARRVLAQRLKTEGALIRIYRNWVLIRVMRLKEREYHSYARSVVATSNQAIRQALNQNAVAVIPFLLGLVVMAVILWGSLEWFGTPPAVLLGFIYLLVRLTQTLNLASDELALARQVQPHAAETVAFLRSLPAGELDTALRPASVLRAHGMALGLAENAVDPADSVRQTTGASTASPSPPEILVSDLTYAWPRSERPALAGVSFRVRAGSVFAIVGPNGSGKSTLLGLILGILKPASGSVHVAGLTAHEYLKTDAPVGYVGDDPCLVCGTVRDNLRYGLHSTLDDAELTSILGTVGLGRRIGSDGPFLDYTLDENGGGLSLGERQRLALARAFIRRPVLLVLDEATSSVDAETEADLARIIAGLKTRCTVLIASHRPGILAAADAALNMNAPTAWDPPLPSCCRQ
ncbi:MAG: ABC transporter ATP-binding protein [Acidobacteriota bacterium]